MKCVILFALSLYILGANAGVADFIVPCLWSDKKCLKESAQKALIPVSGGIKELGMASLDPLHLKYVNGSFAELLLEFTDLVVTELAHCEISEIERPERKKAVLKLNCPFKAVADVKCNGNMLGFDIFGNGKFQMTTENMEIFITVYMEDFEKDGKYYYKLAKYDYTYKSVKDCVIELRNLYDGDRARAEPMEEFLKTNCNEVISVVGKEMMKNVIGYCVKNMGKLFSNVEKNQLELDE